MTENYNQTVPIAILGSGIGSNAGALVRFSDLEACCYKVVALISDNPDSGIIELASTALIPSMIIDRSQNALSISTQLTSILDAHQVQVLVLAGYNRLIPARVLEHMGGRVLNIHPSLLPKFGGKGMYGLHVHEAVLAAGATETGITVHKVSAHYDQGTILAQSQIPLEPNETALTLQTRVKSAEHSLYPAVVNAFCKSLLTST